MANTTIVGIDPGLNGGIAYIILGDNLEPTGASAIPMPTKPGSKGGNDVDAEALYSYVHGITGVWPVQAIGVEIVHSVQGQGITSSFTFGKGYGKVLAAVEILKLPLVLLQPTKWKKLVLDGLGREKADAIRFCLNTFPRLNLKRTERCSTYHDGMADAVCIAEAARRTMFLSKVS